MHALVIDETGGSHGVRDVGLLASIVHRPQARFGGKELHKGVHTKAAMLLEAIINYHVFVDGNKRTGLIAAGRFLAVNGYKLASTNKELEHLALAVSTKEMKVKKIAAWLKKHGTRT